jgi:cation diffusion facilitator family transporter
MTGDRYKKAKKVTLIGALINTLLGFMKLVSGFYFHSHALVADGVHSFSDLITDMMVLFASKYGSQDADDMHHYGHQRFETAATLLLALLLILVGFGIAWDSIYELLHTTSIRPSSWAFCIAFVSILVNEGLFHYTRFVGKSIQSSLIIANAWHHRSDAGASLVVALGILGSLAGFAYLDTIAAIIVGILIIKMGMAYGWNSVKELVDTAVAPDMLITIENHIKHIDGVEKIHQLRTRLMGGDILIDVHILVSPYISVSEGHFIAQQVHHVLIKQIERVKDVIVHVDAEDDEEETPSQNLLSRKILDETLVQSWKQEFPSLHFWTLHYLGGTMRIDLMHHESEERAQILMETIAKELPNFPLVSEVRLFHEEKVIGNSKAYLRFSQEKLAK